MTTCTDRIRTAGITGDIVTKVLADDEANLELPANTVTDLYPNEGESVEAPSDITIYRNPTNPDPLSPEAQDVADALETSPYNDVSVKDHAETLARECVKYASKPGSGVEADDCTTLPVYFGGEEAREATNHDAEAIAAHPGWTVLNARDAAAAGVRRRTQCVGEKVPPNQCDEYPFFSAMQGQDGLLATLPISYKYVNGKQNEAEGRALGVFYNYDSNFGYPQGCRIRKDDETDPFLVVPLPAGIHYKTTWACNRLVLAP